MAIIATKPDGDFINVSEGVHAATVSEVRDVGVVDTQWGQKHKVRIHWKTDEPHPETGEPLIVTRTYTLSIHEKAALRGLVDALVSRPLTPLEERGYNVENLVGTECFVQVVHRTVDGKTFANVNAVMPRPRQVPPPTQSPPVVEAAPQPQPVLEGGHRARM